MKITFIKGGIERDADINNEKHQDELRELGYKEKEVNGRLVFVDNEVTSKNNSNSVATRELMKRIARELADKAEIKVNSDDIDDTFDN